MLYDSFFSNSPFSDKDNFPNGFHNISDFTQIEADVLIRCGQVMKNLCDGVLEPQNKDQERLLDVINGNKKPLYHIEHVFLKYLSLIQNKN